MSSKLPRYLRGSHPELLNTSRPRLVSVESRGVDITPSVRMERWAESHIRPTLPIDPPVDYPVDDRYRICELRERNRFVFLDWLLIGLIFSLSIGALILLCWMITDPVGAGRISAGECYPPACQVASIK